jgi:hypothetical protein
MAPQYEILRASKVLAVGGPASVWQEFPSLRVDHYLWLRNGYEPRVGVRLGLTDRFLYVRFDVEERQVRARFTRFQDPVYKDSCVEFFVDAFPDLRRGYFNFEANALGTFLIAFGPDRRSRTPVRKGDLLGFKSASSIKRPVDGEIATGRRALAYRIPLELFHKMYGRPIRPGGRGAANFYKCGDEAEFPHYGAWSPVGTPSPDFHRPEFFGTLIFGRP